MGTKIYVGNLPWSINDESLRELFEPLGQVSAANVVVDRHSGRSRGFGFVEMSSPEEARQAIQALNGSELEGRALTVDMAKERPRRDDY